MARKAVYRALDTKVLAVAVEGVVGDWSAYIGAVAGRDHDREAKGVMEYGTKLPKAVAEILFPDLKRLRWRG